MTTRKTASKRAAKNPVSKKKSSSVSTRQQAAKKSAAKKSAAAPSASKARKTSRLGRGLDILLGADALAIDTLGELSADAEATPRKIAIDQLTAGRFQPRGRIDETGLHELAESIKSQGIMQAILVRPIHGHPQANYEIIAGERRFRAAQLAGLSEIPVVIRTVSDENAAIMALIENIQREDLNPLEEARAVQRLLDEFGLTHEEAAKAIGRSRSATSNLLRLLNLSDAVQTMLLAGDIDMGHARALLPLDAAQQIMLANEIINRRLSVREAEKLVANHLDGQAHSTKAQETASQSNGDAQRLETALSDFLGTRVRLKLRAKNRGQLLIDFHDWDHLNALLERQGLNKVLDD